MKSVMASVRIMETIGPQWKWTGLGNFLGSYGEFIAITAYGLTKAPGGTEGHEVEIVEADWFSPADAPSFPPGMSIAGKLIDEWRNRVGS